MPRVSERVALALDTWMYTWGSGIYGKSPPYKVITLVTMFSKPVTSSGVDLHPPEMILLGSGPGDQQFLFLSSKLAGRM